VLRTILLMVGLLMAGSLLAGCSDAGLDDLWRQPDARAAADPPAAVPPAIMAYCTRAAQDRATDAERQGFDEATQQTVYGATYADCLNWSHRAL